LRFKTIALVILILATACGPKPDLRAPTDGSPKAIWDTYLQRLTIGRSVALKGSLKIISSKTINCDFEAFYINPDTFNFTAKGPLGVGSVKVILLGDSGYVENSKDKSLTAFAKSDYIYIGDMGSQISVANILQALFLEHPECESILDGQENESLRYLCESLESQTQLLISKENCLPQQQMIATDSEIMTVDYFRWKMFNKNRIYPTKIVMESNLSQDRLIFKIDQLYTNTKISLSLFQKPSAN
jgi:hypothetical protein